MQRCWQHAVHSGGSHPEQKLFAKNVDVLGHTVPEPFKCHLSKKLCVLLNLSQNIQSVWDLSIEWCSPSVSDTLCSVKTIRVTEHFFVEASINSVFFSKNKIKYHNDQTCIVSVVCIRMCGCDHWIDGDRKCWQWPRYTLLWCLFLSRTCSPWHYRQQVTMWLTL